MEISKNRITSLGGWVCFLLPCGIVSAILSSLFSGNSHATVVTLLMQICHTSFYLWTELLNYFPKSFCIIFVPSVFLPIWSLLHFYSNLNIVMSLLAPVVCMFLQLNVVRWLMKNFQKSFSFGEAIFISQGITFSVCIALINLFRGVSFLHTEMNFIILFLQTALLVAFSLAVTLWNLRILCSFLFFIIITIVYGVVGLGLSSLVLGKFSPLWLISTADANHRISLFCIWFLMSVLAMTATGVTHLYANVTKSVVRKFYHLLVVFVFLPGLVLDLPFLVLASTAATVFLLLLELVRVIDVHPVSSLLSDAFKFFLDEKDSGLLVLSHIYLLVSMSLPVWLELLALSEEETVNIHLYSGILSVGIGDSFAAIGGFYLGRTKWPGTNKTLEGTVCSVLSQVMFICICNSFGWVTKIINWINLIFIILVVSLIEAFTNQVDNIVLPLTMYVLMRVLHC